MCASRRIIACSIKLHCCPTRTNTFGYITCAKSGENHNLDSELNSRASQFWKNLTPSSRNQEKHHNRSWNPPNRVKHKKTQKKQETMQNSVSTEMKKMWHRNKICSYHANWQTKQLMNCAKCVRPAWITTISEAKKWKQWENCLTFARRPCWYNCIYLALADHFLWTVNFWQDMRRNGTRHAINDEPDQPTAIVTVETVYSIVMLATKQADAN